MGCTCDFFKKEPKTEMTNDFMKELEQMENDEEKMNLILRIQRNFRSHLIRLKLKSPDDNNISSHANPTLNSSRLDKLEIQEEELESLLKEYPPLNDGVILKINGPKKDCNTHSIYLGEWDFSKDVKHGRGIQYWVEGAKYLGYFTNNKANIKGKLIHKDGDIYEGEWLNDKPNGRGKYTHIDGTIYEGDWKDDKQHGKGKEKWPDGSSYEGDYSNNQKHGKGKLIWADGSEYEGEFSHNNINGYGHYMFADKRTYEGTWVNNKLEGRGIFTWPDGRKYEGEYKNDKKEGFGTFYWSDGKIYKGYWKNGKQNGEGEFYDPKDNTWRKGNWDNGKKVKWH